MIKLKLFLISYYKKYGSFPSLTILSNELKKPLDEIITDLDKLVIKGLLKNIGGEYYFNTIEKIIEKKPEKENIKGSVELPLNIIRLFMAIIAFIAMIMSSFYSAIWFMNFLNPFVSWICACIMVFYASFSIQASVIVNKDLIKYLLRITSVVVIIFSVISTIAGQYRNDFESKEVDKTKSKQIELSLLEEEKQSILNSLESVKKELDDNTKQLDKFEKEEMESKEYKNLFWKSYNLRKAKTEYEKKYIDILERIRDFLNSTDILTKKANTFYEWIAEFLPFNPSMIEFWLYLFPAIFYDVIAPLGLYIALFRKGENTK